MKTRSRNNTQDTERKVMEIQIWPIDKLVLYARNPRKNDAAVDRMCGSIREFGFKIPCLVRSNGELIDGHLRLKAARKLGLAEIPVIRATPFSFRSSCSWLSSDVVAIHHKHEDRKLF